MNHLNLIHTESKHECITCLITICDLHLHCTGISMNYMTVYNITLYTLFNQGFTRLQKLGMCVGKCTVNKKITEAACDFEKQVKSWKSAIEEKKGKP